MLMRGLNDSALDSFAYYVIEGIVLANSLGLKIEISPFARFLIEACYCCCY